LQIRGFKYLGIDMKTSGAISICCFLLGLSFLLVQCNTEGPNSRPSITGQGIGINSVTLMVQDIDSAISYYKDTLGFNIRGGVEKGGFDGTLVSSMYMGDLSLFKFLSVDDSVQDEATAPFVKSFLDTYQGVRLFSVSSSSVDSTSVALTTSGFSMDSIQSYRTTTKTPEGWSWDDGSPKRKSLDFNAANPPAHLPRFIEKLGYGYDKVNSEWNTYYVYRRMYNTHPNGVVGMNAVRVVVNDLEASAKAFRKMGLEAVQETDSLARFRLFRHHEIHLINASTPALKDFLATRGEGVFAMRFDVVNLDSTTQYLEKELPGNAISQTPGLLTVAPEYAFGVQLEFVNEPEAQNILARTYTPAKQLDSLAILHTAALYSKYCALCHGEDREGYAADNAPSLRSKSLLASSMHNNFMRYTIQYGRSNTAMAGYLDRQGGPMEHIEIELMLQWLNEMAGVEEPVKLSREPVLGNIELGATLYAENCAVCHGEDGEGVSAPALGNPMTLATATDHFLRYAIAEGRDGTPMVAYKEILDDEQIDGLVAFLRSRASGWDIPAPDTVSIPTPEEYVLNPEGEDPVFNLREGKYASAEQVNKAFQEGRRMIILDARSEVAWRQMHIPGAIPVPYYEEPENFINDIPNDGTHIVIYCACPHAASGRVQSTLRRHGFKNTAIIDEGILVWAQMGYPVRNGS